MAFLRDEDFIDLPDDDGDAFTRLEAISRERLYQADTDRDGDPTYTAVMGYMNEIAALADEFDIPNLIYDMEPDNFQAEFGRFTRAVEYRLAQIRVKRARRLRRNSVALSGPRRQKIQHYLEKIRSEVQESDVPNKRKRALLDRLAEFERELSKSRFDLMKAMAFVALAAAAVHDFAGAFTETKELVQTISSELGAARVEEDELLDLLPKPEPYRQIPDLRDKGVASSSRDARPSSFDTDLDDDVPF